MPRYELPSNPIDCMTNKVSISSALTTTSTVPTRLIRLLVMPAKKCLNMD